MIERQVIVTWTEPEKKKPEPDVFAILTVSAKVANVTYDHALALATGERRTAGYSMTRSSTELTLQSTHGLTLSRMEVKHE